MTDASNVLAKSGYTMTIKALTGDKHYKGSTVTLNGVRFKTVSGLSFGYGDNDISTFEITCSVIDFSVVPGAIGKISSLIKTVNSLIG